MLVMSWAHKHTSAAVSTEGSAQFYLRPKILRPLMTGFERRGLREDNVVPIIAHPYIRDFHLLQKQVHGVK